MLPPPRPVASRGRSGRADRRARGRWRPGRSRRDGGPPRERPDPARGGVATSPRPRHQAPLPERREHATSAHGRITIRPTAKTAAAATATTATVVSSRTHKRGEGEPATGDRPAGTGSNQAAACDTLPALRSVWCGYPPRCCEERQQRNGPVDDYRTDPNRTPPRAERRKLHSVHSVQPVVTEGQRPAGEPLRRRQSR